VGTVERSFKRCICNCERFHVYERRLAVRIDETTGQPIMERLVSNFVTICQNCKFVGPAALTESDSVEMFFRRVEEMQKIKKSLKVK
jgi:hypothetical protein